MRARTPALFVSIALGATLLAATLLAGCPRELQPPPPGDAAACETLEDCNAGRSCGELALCVGGFCEESTTFAIPCPGDGVPIVIPEPEVETD
ncbi:hypothetical protein [Sandaracinus amylolyticus]|nr:hypothetical protein [Sandaracinus amylolyticus]